MQNCIGSKMKYALLFLFLVCVFSCTYCSIIRRSQSFRSKKSPSETIYNYVEVRPVVISSTQVSSENHPKYLKVVLRLDEAQFNLDLQLNELLLPPHFSSIHQDQSGEEIKNGHQNCFYQGTVLNHTDWKATFSTCYGLRGWFGDINDKNYLYHIEPLDNTNTLTSLHAIYMESEHKNTKIGTCGTTHHHVIENTITKQSFRHHRLKRNEDLIVELLVVNDYYQYMAYDEDLSAVVMRAIEIVNQVDMLYQDLNIRVVLVNSMTWTQSQLIPFQTDANTLLTLFETYHSDNISPSISHDSAMMITGINIAGNTVGIAYVGTMCNFDTSVGVTQDTGSSVSSVGATAAHELGHIFVMRHDDDSNCNCPDQSSSGCIMNAASGFPPPTQWSQCSRDELDFGFENGLGRCLDNNPTTIVGEPQCGNGIKEPDEVCDCGSPEECLDPCCNATACVLNNNAQCATGPCCTNCQFLAYGTTCRKSDGVCDITEYCTGEDSDCPRDVYLQNGHPCNNSFYCYGGNCISHDTQCMQYYGTVSQTSIDACYDQLNIQGQNYGNCGAANGAYISCPSNHVQCGSLQCNGGAINFDNIQFTGSIFSFTRQVISQGSVHNCQSFTLGVNSDVISPGLVIDGTKCGNEMLCVAQQCRAISSLSITACPVGENGETCSGNGVCNDINECSCFVGYRGDDCSSNIESTNAPNPVTESTNAPNPTIESTNAPNTGTPNTGTEQTIMSTFTESSIFQSATIRPSSVASSSNVIIVGVVVPIILIALAAVVIVIIVLVVVVVKKKKSANVDLSPKYSKGTRVNAKINGSSDDLLMSAQRIDSSSPTNVRRPPPSKPYNPPYTPSNPSVTVNNNIRRPPPSVPPSPGATKNPYVVVNNAYKRPPPPTPPSTKSVSVNQGNYNQSRKPPPPVTRPAPRPAPRSPPSVPVSKPTPVTAGPSKPVVPPPKPQIAPKPQTAPKPQVPPTPQTAPKPSQIHRQWPPPSQQGDKPIPPKRPFLPSKN